MDNLSRRFVLTSGLAFAAAPGFAQEGPAYSSGLRPMRRPQSLGTRSDAAQLIRSANLSGVTSVMAFDSQPLTEIGADRPLPPASVMKTLTAAYALDRLGSTHRFETRYWITGEMVEDTLHGDLWIEGRGDPTPTTDSLVVAIEDIKALGLRRVLGRLFVAGTQITPVDQIDPGQPVQVGYNPTLSGLMLNSNRVFMEWKRAGGRYTTKVEARGDTASPVARNIQVNVTSGQGAVWKHRIVDGTERWSLERSAMGEGGWRWLPVRAPEMYFGDTFQLLARDAGLILPPPHIGHRPPLARMLHRDTSADLPLVLKDTLRYSNNMYAEICGLQATGPMAARDVSAKAAQDWLGARGHKFLIRDHSGLLDTSRVAPRALAGFFADPQIKASLFDILKTYPLRREDDSLIEGAEVRAKTGSLNFVSTLAGYLIRPDGSHVTFAIQSADLPRRERIPRAQKEAPQGGRSWARRARKLQFDLIKSWL